MVLYIYMLTYYYFYVFICRPTGWDNEKKIAILHENFQSVKPVDAFEDVIAKPVTRKVRFYGV